MKYITTRNCVGISLVCAGLVYVFFSRNYGELSTVVDSKQSVDHTDDSSGIVRAPASVLKESIDWARVNRTAHHGETKEREQLQEAWLEKRAKWIEQFPFEPKYNAETSYDSDALAQLSLKSFAERKENGKRLLEWGKSYRQGNKQPWVEHRGATKLLKKKQQELEVHSFLAAFYENPLIYTEAFESIYKIVNEYSDSLNPVSLGWIFNGLNDYNQRVVPLLEHNNNKMTDDELETKNIIENNILSQLMFNFYEEAYPEYEVMDEETARKVLDLLMEKVPTAGMRKKNPETSFLYPYFKRGFFISGKHEALLEDGDALLRP